MNERKLSSAFKVSHACSSTLFKSQASNHLFLVFHWPTSAFIQICLGTMRKSPSRRRHRYGKILRFKHVSFCIFRKIQLKMAAQINLHLKILGINNLLTPKLGDKSKSSTKKQIHLFKVHTKIQSRECHRACF